jgi:hypothetical protein
VPDKPQVTVAAILVIATHRSHSIRDIRFSNEDQLCLLHDALVFYHMSGHYMKLKTMPFSSIDISLLAF